jgi:hypothetical protein
MWMPNGPAFWNPGNIERDDMPDKHSAQLGLLFVVPGILMQVASVSAGLYAIPAPCPEFWPAIALGSTMALVTGLSFNARSKGYSPLLGLLACLGPIGLLSLVLLPDRRSEG